MFLFQRSPWIHGSEAALQFAENMMFMFLCRINRDIAPRTGQEEFQVLWGYHLRTECTILGHEGNLMEPLPLFFLASSLKSLSDLHYDRRLVGQSVLMSTPHLGSKTRVLLMSDSCRLVDVGRPLWWEDSFVVCNCCWPLAVQSFSAILASNHYVNCQMLVTRHGVFIDNCIYWTLVTTSKYKCFTDLCTVQTIVLQHTWSLPYLH
jgi:hypothetical protein